MRLHLLKQIPDEAPWSKGDLNPHAFRHMSLKHACLPIPPFDRGLRLRSKLSFDR